MFDKSHLREMGKYLRRARIDMRLKQNEAAKQIGVNHMTLSAYENGQYAIPFPRLLHLALLYRCSIHELVPVDFQDVFACLAFYDGSRPKADSPLHEWAFTTQMPSAANFAFDFLYGGQEVL